jgi:hypothetical protein
MEQVSMKRREHRLKPDAKKKTRQTARRTKSQKRIRRKGLGTRIASAFRDIGLRPGEEIQELRIQIQPVDFEE